MDIVSPSAGPPSSCSFPTRTPAHQPLPTPPAVVPITPPLRGRAGWGVMRAAGNLCPLPPPWGRARERGAFRCSGGRPAMPGCPALLSPRAFPGSEGILPSMIPPPKAGDLINSSPLRGGGQGGGSCAPQATSVPSPRRGGGSGRGGYTASTAAPSRRQHDNITRPQHDITHTYSL